MKYTTMKPRRRWPRRLFVIAIIGIVGVIGATIVVRYAYTENLKPVDRNSQEAKVVTITSGMTVDQIAAKLQKEGVIRSAWAFKLYVSSKEARSALKAGTYELEPSRSVAEVVARITDGKIATNLVTIAPGRRLDQIKKSLVEAGFSEAGVQVAISNPSLYKGHPALVDKPEDVSLEGYLFPDSYQRTKQTEAQEIIRVSLDEMQKQLTPDRRNAFGKQGLSTYEAIILASVVEREVPKDEDRKQVAQIFLKRLKIGMRLESDATASYGAVLDGKRPTSGYDSPYNTYRNKGLPPTPISNVSASSLDAVAYPADTDWLYFVSGDDGTTHFSKTLPEHEEKTRQHCSKCAPV